MTQLNWKSLIRLMIIISPLYFSQCTEDETAESLAQAVKFPDVTPELRPYFQRFEDEAAARGISVDLTAAKIIGVIEEIDEEHVAGQCSYGGFNPRKVTVDKTFWDNSPDFFREFIVFHELGHCYLDRDHLETSLSNGACVSIMRSGNGNCLDNYRASTREYYITELLDPESVNF